MASVGTVIGGKFRVDQFLGFGGMGLVVAATHLELGHRVAIKFLRNEMAASPTVVERFVREARSVVQLRTEHVCRVTDVGRTDAGAPYMVMELLEGSDLGRVVAKQPLPVTVACEYVLQACVGIAEAHAAGIIHRDLKPANLFVTRRPGGGPLIKVLDFGIAKAVTEAGAQLTHSSSMLGSPAYISPEQLQSARDVDARTDIWALGATLYQLLSARLPFHRPNVTEMAVRIVTEPPDPLDVDPALRAVVLRCLEKQPAQRYPDVAALAAELAPFGGPSGRAFAALVGKLLRGAAATQAHTPAPVISPFADTAASRAGVTGAGGPPRTATAAVSAAGLAAPPAAMAPGGRGATAAAGPGGFAAASVAHGAAAGAFAPPVAPGAGGFAAGQRPPARRNLAWWIGAPLVVLASAGVALVLARPGATPAPTAGSAAVVVAGSDGPVAVAAPPAAAPSAPVSPAPPPAAAPSAPAPAAPAAPAPSGAVPSPPPPAGSDQPSLIVPPDPAAHPKDPRPRTIRPRPPQPAAPASGSAAHAPPPPPPASAPAAGSAGDPSKRATITSGVAASAREAKDTCLEATADTPWNTAMCWCSKKDRARAQAAYARLSKFKQFTVRKYCAVRGINL